MLENLESELDEDLILSIEDLYAIANEMKMEGKIKMAKQACMEGIQKIKNGNDKSMLFSFQNLISQICMEMKDYEQAIDYCQEMIEADSLFFEARLRMASLLNIIKAHDLALQSIDEAFRLMKEHPSLSDPFLLKKFTDLKETILIETSHSHVHHHQKPCAAAHEKQLDVYLIRSLDDDVAQLMIEEFKQLSQDKTSHYLILKTTSVDTAVPGVFYHNTKNIMMQCLMVYEQFKKSTSQTGKLFVHASPNLSIDEFKDDPHLKLKVSGLVLDCNTFKYQVRTNHTTIELIESSNVFMLRNADSTLATEASEILKSLNSNAIVADCNHVLDDILQIRNEFSFDTLMNGITWLNLMNAKETPSMGENIVTFVYKARKPIHLDLLHHTLKSTSEESNLFFDTVLRSKGFIWVEKDPDYMYDWSTLGGELHVLKKMMFLAAYPQDRFERIPQERLADIKRINKWEEPNGDKRQEIAFICFKSQHVQDPQDFITNFLNRFLSE